MNSARFDYILRQVLIVPVLAALVGASAVYWAVRSANQTVSLIEASDLSIASTLIMERLIADQETGLRGFQTTGNTLFLAPYNEAEHQYPSALRDLRASIVPSALPDVDAFDTLHGAWDQGFAVPLIATTRAGGKTSDTDLNLQGKISMDAMRRQLVRLSSDGQQQRAAHIQRWQTQVHRMALALILFAVLLGLLIGLYIRTLMHDLSAAFKRSAAILRLRADEAARSEQRLRTTLASIGDGVITCSTEGLIQTLNAAAEQLTGWPEHDARNKPLNEIFTILDTQTRQRLEDPIARGRRANTTVKLGENALLIRRDGSEIHVDDSLAPIRDKHAETVGYILVFRDVTLARKSQQALLANEKLAVAGRLAATIAHEIHNPLDSISNLLFLMDGPSTPEESAHFLELAREEIARVTSISRAMLSLYREAKAPIAVDLRDMLQSILLLMERRFNALGVFVEQDLPSGLIIHGFPAELRQVFTNLLTNAAEAAGQGGAVRIVAADQPEHLNPDTGTVEPGVLVTVEDAGPGIPPETQRRLFQPFFTTKGEQGTGLGLWVSRGIITKHGGEITLASSTDPTGHGTTVSVFLARNPTINAGAA